MIKLIIEVVEKYKITTYLKSVIRKMNKYIRDKSEKKI